MLRCLLGRSGIRVKARIGLLLAVTWGGFIQSATAQMESPLVWKSPSPESPLFLDQPYPLEVESINGAPVSFRVRSGPAVIDGDSVTVTDLGPVVLVAQVEGDSEQEGLMISQIFNRSDFELTRLGSYATSGCVVDVHVQGHLAFLAKGPDGLEIVDVSDPSNPESLASYQAAGRVDDTQSAGDLLYVAAGEAGLEILNLEDLRNPVRVGRYESVCRRVVLVGNLAHLVGDGCVEIVDISQIDQIKPVSQYCGDHDGMVIRDLKVWGTTAYLSMETERLIDDPEFACEPGEGRLTHARYADTGELVLFDFSDPSNPVRLDSTEEGTMRGTGPWGVAMDDEFLVLANGTRGLNLFDIQSAPLGHLSSYRDPSGQIVSIEMRESLVFAGAFGNRFVKLVDIANPLEPVTPKVVSRVFVEPFHNMALHGQRVYLATGKLGLDILEFAPLPLEPDIWVDLPRSVRLRESSIELTTVKGRFDDRLQYRVIEGFGSVDGKVLNLTGQGKLVLEVRLPESRQFAPQKWTQSFKVFGKDEQQLEWVFPGPEKLVPIGRPCRMICAASSGLSLTFRVENGPASIEGDVLTVHDVGPVTLVASQAGNAEYHPATSLRLVNPAPGINLRPLHQFDPSEPVDYVDVVGNRAYLANGTLRILDVSDPTVPKELGVYGEGFADGVLVVGSYAYGTDRERGIEIVDVSEPENPRLAGRINNLEFSADRVRVEGSVAYVSGGHRMQVMDVSNPSNPVLLSYFEHPYTQSLFMDVVDGVAYLMRRHAQDWHPIPYWGAVAIDFRPPSQPLEVLPSRLIELEGTHSRIPRKAPTMARQVVGDHLYIVGGVYNDLLTYDIGSRARTYFCSNYRLRNWGPGPEERGAPTSFGVIDVETNLPLNKRQTIVEVEANLAFVRWYDTYLEVVDVSDANDPKSAARIRTGPGESGNLKIEDDVLYVPLGEYGMETYAIEYHKHQQAVALTDRTRIDLAESPLKLPRSSAETVDLPLNYAVLEGPARIEGDQLILTGQGPVVLSVEHSGNQQFQGLSERWEFTVTDRPMLKIQLAGEENVRLEVATELGFIYRIEQSDSMTSSEWETVDRTDGTGEPWIWVGVREETPERYYRVVEEAAE